MIKVVMFDLGATLIDANRRPFSHALQAVEAIQKTNVKSCLVSDFKMELTTAAAMKEYKKILEEAGLLPLFEPVAQRVTLSNHASALKPDRKIFQKALQRLGSSATPFSECLLITENAAHVQAARDDLGMKALQFGKDFTDWSAAPARIFAFEGETEAWKAIAVPGHPDLQGLQVKVLGGGAEHIEEAVNFTRSLADNNQIAGRPGQPAVRATHSIETGADGNRKLVRKRYTAL